MLYALRRLTNNIQEPYRTVSLQAIDASIKWWQGKPAPRASALRAPWSLSPNLQRTLKQFLRKWHLQILAYQVPCHLPSFKTVFIKHAAVLDQLCNHKQAISQWSTGTDAICCCQRWSKYKKAALNPPDPHWVLAGSLLHDLLPADLSVIAEGSLLNKVFPSKKDYQSTWKLGLHQWTKRNGLPSMPSQDILDLAQLLWQQHTQEVTCHITKSSITTFQRLFDGAIFHCEDKQASSLRNYCPCLYYQAIETTFTDLFIFEPVNQDPSTIVDTLVSQLTKQYGKSYPWATGTQTKQLMEEQFSDAMSVTSCEQLPDLRTPEEMALFTYARLLNPSQLQTTSVGDLLYHISLYIYNTWGVNIGADAMDL